ncbi:YlbF/YmcA family competence regulator [Streptococcus sp. X16XC17]|uniref:YlbF/YmcA family competence regulator n=1 Tax=unclassified Streptococcus TaxID=2608887 RepID=UPI00066FCF74|nr:MULTISPECIES: YlbF/YmcA family competence regulator [unclassified Streptococcus]TCD46500.1 YlbF/YmcA family competence regulator [Streptococcus sp. X16XC17]
MTQNIYDLANELERSIRHLPEYEAVQASRKEIEADKDAKELLDQYISHQTELQQVLQTGQMPSEDFQKNMQDLGQKIQENPLLTEYFGKQQQLSIYIADIEKIIFKPLQDLI